MAEVTGGRAGVAAGRERDERCLWPPRGSAPRAGSGGRRGTASAASRAGSRRRPECGSLGAGLGRRRGRRLPPCPPGAVGGKVSGPACGFLWLQDGGLGPPVPPGPVGPLSARGRPYPYQRSSGCPRQRPEPSSPRGTEAVPVPALCPPPPPAGAALDGGSNRLGKFRATSRECGRGRAAGGGRFLLREAGAGVTGMGTKGARQCRNLNTPGFDLHIYAEMSTSTESGVCAV